MPAGEVTTLREAAYDLANKSLLRESLPLFEATCALQPTDPQFHNDLGVTWMRLSEWAQAWGALGRALALDPTHKLAVKNLNDLRSFLGTMHPVVVANSHSPPRSQPRPREHAVEPLPRYATLAAASAAEQDGSWWHRPFVFVDEVEAASLAPSKTPPKMPRPQIERVLVELLASEVVDARLVTPRAHGHVAPVSLSTIALTAIALDTASLSAPHHSLTMALTLRTRARVRRRRRASTRAGARTRSPLRTRVP